MFVNLVACHLPELNLHPLWLIPPKPVSACSILSAYGALWWTLLLLYSLLLSLSVVSDPLRPRGPEPGSFPVLRYFSSKLKYGTSPQAWLPWPQDSPSTWTLSSKQWSRRLTFTVCLPSRLQYVLWPQGLRPLPHSSTDTGESTQWIWAASLPVQTLTSAHSLGALRGVGSVGASQELPVAAARGQDLKARECFHGWLREPAGNKQFFEGGGLF